VTLVVFAVGQPVEPVQQVGQNFGRDLAGRDALQPDIRVRVDQIALRCFEMKGVFGVVAQQDLPDGIGHDAHQSEQDSVQHAVQIQRRREHGAQFAQGFRQHPPPRFVGEEGRIAQRDRHRIRQRLNQGDVFVAEGVRFRALDIKHAEHVRPDADGHRHFAARILDAGTGQVEFILLHVAADHRLAGARHARDHAVAVDAIRQFFERPAPAVYTAPTAEGQSIPDAQEQMHPIIAEILRYQIDHFVEDVVNVQVRHDRARQIDQRIHALGLAAFGVIRFRLLQRHRDLTGQCFEHEHIIVAESIQAVALHV
jgi:hypothetical protein